MFQPVFTRVQSEDLGKDSPKSVGIIVTQLNLIIDYLTQAFGNQITIQANLANPIRTLTITSTGTPAKDTVSFSPGSKLPSGYQPIGVIILNCIDNSGSIVGNAVTCEMAPGLQNGNILIRAIYGLTSGHSYTITFMVF